MSHLLAVRKGEDVMSAMTGNLRRAILLGVVGTLAVAGVARADVASDKPGAILIFPKIVVDTGGVLGPKTDTEVQVTNTSNSVIGVRCFWIDGTSHCDNKPTQACTTAGVNAGISPDSPGCPPGGRCLGPCTVPPSDFRMTLTKRQPIVWKASEGLSNLPCGKNSNGVCVAGTAVGQSCGADSDCGSGGVCSTGGCPPNQSNGTSSIQNVQEDPFIGELKCVEVSPDDFLPINGLDPANNFIGDLKGEATIVSVQDGGVDSRKYNGIGLQATSLANTHDDTLQVGGPGAEYNACPKTIIVDNMFDNAKVFSGATNTEQTVTTDLTFVPCTEDLNTNVLTPETLQFLVFNEFEQRFSTSIGFSCFKEVQLSDIDTRPGLFGNNQSIFNWIVQGTLSGQIRIRPVAGASTDNRVLAVSEEFWTCEHGVPYQSYQFGDTTPRCSAAVNTNIVPGAGNGDVISLSPP